MSTPSDRNVDVTLKYSGTAKLGTDYKINGLTNGKLRIPAGQLRASFVVEILHDTVYEGNETFNITIDSVSAPAALPKGTKPLRPFTIIDDDKKAATKPSATPTSHDVLSFPPGALAIDPWPSTGTHSTQAALSPVGVSTRSTEWVNPWSLAIGVGNQGPIENAVAYFDRNFNLILDEDELSSPTAIDGSFTIPLESFDSNQNGVIDLTEGRLVLSGGTDLASGLTWKMPLTAPIGLFNLTPISTLVESLIRTESLSLSEGMSRVTKALGIDNYNLLGSNSIYEVLAKDGLSAKAYSIHTQLYSVVISIAQLLAGKSGRVLDALGLSVYDQIANLVFNSPDSVLDLTSPEVLQGIIGSTASSQVITDLDPATIASAASIISNGTSRVAAISLTESAAGNQYLLSINKAKTVLQGSLPDALFELGNGTKTASQVEAEFTGAALDSKIAAVNATLTVPPAIGINSVAIVEGNSGQSTLRFSVVAVGEHNYPISTDYFTVDGTAEAGSDYTSTTGTLSWAANDNSIRYIDIPLLGDASFEADEYFKVLLSNSNGLVIRVDEGYGYILNDESMTLQTSSSTTITRFAI